MKKVLLTGGTGFIGSNAIQPLLDTGFDVHAVTRGALPADERPVTWHSADLLDRDAAAAVVREVRPSHLLHLAWYVEPGKLIDSPLNLDWLMASIDLVREFAEAGGKRATLCGSAYEYDWRYGYCSESVTPTQPDTMYGVAKDALYRTLRRHSLDTGLSFSWGRAFFLYGPFENPRRLASSVILSLLRGEEARSSHGLQIRDYAHVRDVAEGLVALLDSGVEGDVNIATGQATRIRDIVETIGDLLGRSELVKIGALPARKNDVPLVVADVTKAERELGWSARFDLRAGLEDTIDWWRNHEPEENS